MKTAVVTGSIKGIGKSIGDKLLDNGYYVIFNYSNDDNTARDIELELNIKYPGRFSIIKADLSSMEGVLYFVAKCLEISSSFDCIILNAGCTDRTPFKKIEYETWLKVMNTNLNMPFFIVQQFSDYINDNVGRIVFIGSIMGIKSHSVSISYGVSKAGIHFLAKSLVKEFANRRITVNAVCPGFVDTPWQNGKSIEQKKRIEEKIALKTFARVENISEMVLSVINNNYINGTVIEIDGGYDYK